MFCAGINFLNLVDLVLNHLDFFLQGISYTCLVNEIPSFSRFEMMKEDEYSFLGDPDTF